MPKTIVVIGGFVTDLVTVANRCPDAGETLTSTSFSQHPGGKGANSAVAAYRLSHHKPVSAAQPTSTAQAASATQTVTITPPSFISQSAPVTFPNDDHVNSIIEGPEMETQTGLAALPSGENVNEVAELDRDVEKDVDDNEIQVRMTGALGDDGFAERLLKVMTDNGVDVSKVRKVKDQPTGVGVVIVETNTEENRILFYPGANYDLMPEDFETLESLNGLDGKKPDLLISQMELRRETVEQLLKTASEHGVDTLLNPAPAHALVHSAYKMITHLVVNETEAAMLANMDVDKMTDETEYGKVTDEFLKRGIPNVVVTLGAKGAYYSNEIGKGSYVEAEKDVKVKDTTGAGYVRSHSLFPKLKKYETQQDSHMLTYILQRYVCWRLWCRSG